MMMLLVHAEAVTEVSLPLGLTWLKGSASMWLARESET